MPEVRAQGPRRVKVVIDLHPADIAHCFMHDEVLRGMTDDELRKIETAAGTELQDRVARRNHQINP